MPDQDRFSHEPRRSEFPSDEAWAEAHAAWEHAVDAAVEGHLEREREERYNCE